MSQPAQQQTPPGTQAEMTPEPDCGEQSYRGSGRLAGQSPTSSSQISLGWR